MNLVFVLILILFLLCIHEGYRRGLLMMIYGLMSWIIALVIVTALNPAVTTFLEDNTKLDDTIYTHVEEYIEDHGITELVDFSLTDMFKSNTSEEDSSKSDASDGNVSANGSISDSDSTVGSLADKNEESLFGIDITDTVSDLLDKDAGDVVDDLAKDMGLYEKIAKTVTHYIVQGIALIITLILCRIIMAIIESALKVLSSIPGLSWVNRVLGMLAGLVKGLLITWLVFYIISICSATEFGNIALQQIKENAILTYIYKNNLLLEFVLGFIS